MVCLGIAERLAWHLRGIAGLPSGCRGVTLGFAHGLLWDWRGTGIAKGLPRDYGFANGLFWDSAIVALGLPRESRAMALGVALGLP